MSNIDLSNPKVLKNFIRSQISENQGKIIKKESVYVFVDSVGSQFVVPDDLKADMDKIAGNIETVERVKKGMKEELKEVKEVDKEVVKEVDINDLREKYKEKHGKKPFAGWSAEQILEKLK